MAVTNFVPDIWSARILTNLSKTAVGAAICNRDYEGDASVGDSVKVTSIVDPTITAYTGADMTPEDIDDATRSLLLDQKKSFNFYLDDVERAQSVKCSIHGPAVAVVPTAAHNQAHHPSLPSGLESDLRARIAFAHELASQTHCMSPFCRSGSCSHTAAASSSA